MPGDDDYGGYMPPDHHHRRMQEVTTTSENESTGESANANLEGDGTTESEESSENIPVDNGDIPPPPEEEDPGEMGREDPIESSEGTD